MWHQGKLGFWVTKEAYCRYLQRERSDKIVCMREVRDFYKFLSQGEKYRKSGIKSSMQSDFLTFVARNLLLIVSKFNTEKIYLFWHLVLKLTDGVCV